jgi:formate hydrogenlyase subunit 6/NADH:ubiquinone oxidoreductase subunit I
MKKPGAMVMEVLRNAGRKPATVLYPAVRVTMPEKFRGRLKFSPEKCIGCKLCMRDCPARAITIRKIADKQFEAEIDLGKCVYCAQCVETCPKKALEATGEFELAQLDRVKLVFTTRGEPPAPAAATPAGTPATAASAGPATAPPPAASAAPAAPGNSDRAKPSGPPEK